MAHSSTDIPRVCLEVAVLPDWETAIAGSEIRCYSLPAKKSCHSNDDALNRIQGLLDISPLLLLSSASQLAKLPSARASAEL